MKTNKTQRLDLLWDLFCAISIIGIWPRYIEPRLLSQKKLTLTIPGIEELKVLHFSDLHLYPKSPTRPLKKLIEVAKSFKPDLILFTGDFLCQSKLSDKERLKKYLNQFSAPMGCFAILGNHDYEEMVDLTEEGQYDVTNKKESFIAKAFRRFFGSHAPPPWSVTEKAKKVPKHKELIALLAETPFQLLYNETIQRQNLNITGLGEYMFGRADVTKAFQKYDKTKPGIALLHNPDALPLLKESPGDLVLLGHTHGGQVNLPLVWNRFAMMEQPEYKRGYHKIGKKHAYINRGIGASMNFRLFSRPEVLLLTLKGENS